MNLSLRPVTQFAFLSALLGWCAPALAQTERLAAMKARVAELNELRAEVADLRRLTMQVAALAQPAVRVAMPH